jgi:spermidine synthase
LFARSAYWCIARTIEACGFEVKPYHAFVPSFGEWGFVLATRRRFDAPAGFTPGNAPEGLRYLDGPTMSSLFQLPVDLGPLPVEVNRLNNQILVHYYETEWRKWN